MSCVLLDVDGTLLAGPSSEVMFIAYLARHGYLSPARLARLLWFYARWAGTYGRHVAKKNKAYLSGLPVNLVEQIAEKYVEEKMIPRLRPMVLARLDKHVRAGDHIVLLTGTPEFIAAPLARHLGVHQWIATRCANSHGIFTAAPPVVHPFAEEKRHLAHVLCQKSDCLPAKCFAYADSWHDRLLLEFVGHPVAVFPDKTLYRYAKQHGWAILGETKDGEWSTASQER
jgi:HAD superfamily hydrolase (TIGR01490 family)